MGRKQTPETRAKLRKAALRQWSDPAARARARERARATPAPKRDKQVVRRVALQQREAWTPERRERARAAALARYDDQTTRADSVYDGARFGRLTVLVQRLQPPARPLGGAPQALLLCDCGEHAIVSITQLTKKQKPTTSCGCKGVEAARRAVARAEGRLAYQLRIVTAKQARAAAVAAELGVR